MNAIGYEGRISEDWGLKLKDAVPENASCDVGPDQIQDVDV